MMPTTVLYSRGVPSIDLGKQGDYCVDIDAVRMYGPKNKNRQWGPGVSLEGLQGSEGNDGYGAQWRFPKHYKAGTVVGLGDVGFVECEIEHDSESLEIPAIPGRAPISEQMFPCFGSGDGNLDDRYVQLRQPITIDNINLEENCLELDEAIWGKYIYEGMPFPAIRARVGHFGHPTDAYDLSGPTPRAKTLAELEFSNHALQFRGRLSLGTATAFPASGYVDVNSAPLTFNDTDVYTFISYGLLEYAIMVNDAYCMNFSDPSALDGTLIITREGTTDTVIIDSLIHGESTSIVGNPPGRVVLRNAVESWLTTGTAPTQMPTFTNGLGAQESFNSSPNEHSYYLRRIEPGKYRLWNEVSNTAMTFTSKGTRGAGGLTLISACNMTRHLQQEPNYWKNVMFIGDWCYVRATRAENEPYPDNIAIRPLEFDKVYILQRDWQARNEVYDLTYPYTRRPDSYNASDNLYRIREAVQGSPWLTFGNSEYGNQNAVILTEVFPHELPAHADTPTWEEIADAPCLQYVKRTVRGFFAPANVTEATPDIPERESDYAPGKPSITLPEGAVGITSVKSAGNDTICLLRPVLGSPGYLIGREEEANPLTSHGFTDINGGVEPTDGAAFSGLGAIALTRPTLTVWENNTVAPDGSPVFNNTKTESTFELTGIDEGGRVLLSDDPTNFMNQPGGKRSFWGAFEFGIEGATPPVIQENTLYLFVEENVGYSIFRIGATQPIDFANDETASDDGSPIAEIIIARYVNGHRTGQIAKLKGVKIGQTEGERDIVDFEEIDDIVFKWCTGPLIAGTSPAGCFRAQLPPESAGAFIPPEFQRTYDSGAIFGDYYFDGATPERTFLFRSGGTIRRNVDTLYDSRIPFYASLEIEYVQTANALPLWRALEEAFPDYHPKYPGDWASVPPNTVGRALDRLASEIAMITKLPIYHAGLYDGLTLFNNVESVPQFATINGRVLDQFNGQPIPNADVYVNGTGLDIDAFHTTTNGAGSFSIPNVPVQTISISAIPIDNSNQLVQRNGVVLTAGENEIATLYSARALTPSFFGKVTNADGPLPTGIIADEIYEFEYFAFGTTYSIKHNGIPVPSTNDPISGTPIITLLDGNMSPTADTVGISALMNFGFGFPMLITLSRNVNEWLSGSTPLPTDATVNGYVKDEDTGLAIAGATVSIGLITTTTNGAGSFSLPGIALGARTIAVTADGYVDGSHNITAIAGINNLVSAIILTKVIDNSSGTVSGRVINISDGIGIAGVYVTIGATTVRTNGAGSWSIFGVAIGPQTITYHVTGFTDTARNITVVYGANNVGTVAMSGVGGGSGDTTGTVTGTVTNSQGGAAIEGALVTIGVLTDTTDVNGAFSIASVPFGSQSISVTKAGFDEATASVNVGAGTNPAGAIQMTATVIIPGTGTVSGTVLDVADSTPLQGVTVTIGAANTTTNAQGNFSIASVALGARTIVFTLSNFGTVSNDITVIEGANALGNITMVTTLGTITGTVVDIAGGAPIAGVNVAIGFITDVTDAQGLFSLPGIATGAQTLIVNASNYDIRNIAITVIAGANAQGNIELTATVRTMFSGKFSHTGAGALPTEINTTDIYDFYHFSFDGINHVYAVIVQGQASYVNFADPTTLEGTTTITEYLNGSLTARQTTLAAIAMQGVGDAPPDMITVADDISAWLVPVQQGGGGSPNGFYGKLSVVGGTLPAEVNENDIYGFLDLGSGTSFAMVLAGGDGTPIDFATSTLTGTVTVTRFDIGTNQPTADTATLTAISQGGGGMPDTVAITGAGAWVGTMQGGGGGSPSGFYGILSFSGTPPAEINNTDAYTFIDLGGGHFAMTLYGQQTMIDFASNTIDGTITITQLDPGTGQPTANTATLSAIDSSNAGPGGIDFVTVTGDITGWVQTLQQQGGGGGGGPSLFFGMLSNTGGGSVPAGSTADTLYGFIDLGGGSFAVTIPGGNMIDFGTSAIDNGTIVTHCDPSTFAPIPGETLTLAAINQGAGPGGIDTIGFVEAVPAGWIIAG